MIGTLSLEDKLAIQELIARYALYADEGDHDAVAALLAHTDMYVQGALVVSKDPALIRRKFAATPRPEGVGRRHVTTNVIVEPAGPDLAAASSYFVWTESLPATAPRMLMCGVYRDRFERVGGAWRFCERRILTDGAPSPAPTRSGG